MSAERQRGTQRRTMANWLGSVLSLTLALGAGAQPSGAGSPSRREQAFAQAMALYDRSHWASAWRSFAELADTGVSAGIDPPLFAGEVAVLR